MSNFLHNRCTEQGVTLIEALIVLVLLAVVSTVFIGLNGQLFWQSTYMRNLQMATPLQQACIELVLSQRKSLNSTNFLTYTFDCSALNTQGFTLSVSNAASVQYCPGGSLVCRQIEISVSGNSISPGKAALLFVNN